MTETTNTVEQPAEVVEGAELVDFMTRRARTYGLLARIFRVEVDGKFLEELRRLKFPTSTGNEHADYGYRAMYNYLKGTWEDTLLDLARDYARTFIGHGNNGRSAAYPFESVHTSEKRLLMQDARDEVLAMYRENLLKKGQEWNDCEDHIALELEFMQVLCNRTAEALKKGDEDSAVELLKTQRAFVGQHLANWVPMFVSDIKYFAQTDLYIGAGEVLLGFIQEEVETLDDLLDGVDA